MATVSDVSQEVVALTDELIALRREFHEYPELAFEEFRTADLIARRLEALGLAVERNIGVTGVLAFLEGASPGKTLMIRADMDALPMPEAEGRPYGSKLENRNHSCGHDMNMSIVIETAKVLAAHRESIAGRVAFVFQPADEPQLGAKRMIDDGLLDKVKPDLVLAQHPLADVRAGTAVVQPGPLWASGDVMKLTIAGPASTLRAPHEGVDCVLVAAQVVTALYAMVHRESPVLEPAMFNVTSLQASQTPPTSQAELEIRLAVFNEPLRQKLLRRIDEVVRGIVSSMGGECAFETVLSIPPLVNDPTVTAAVANATKQVLGEGSIIQGWRNYFSDDFAFFATHAPGCLFILGSANPDKGITGRTHSPEYDIDEDMLPAGVEIMSLAALELLR